MTVKGTHGAAWTEPRVKRLTDLYAQGVSCSVIARDLGGVSRNAVIGKIHRLNLARRNTLQRKPTVQPPRYAKRKIKPKTAFQRFIADQERDPLPIEPIADVARVSLIDLEPHHCRWVVGEPSEMRFCGAEKVPGLPYCQCHGARAYRAPYPATGRPSFVIGKTLVKYCAPISRDEREEVLS